MNKLTKTILISLTAIIISGFAFTIVENEAEDQKWVDENIPARYPTVLPLDEFLEEDLALKERTEEIIEERNIDYQEPERPKGRWVRAMVTAYEPSHVSCGPYADGKTSTGVNVLSADPHKAYGFAVDPTIIPYGTRIYVPGYWEALQRNRNPDFRPTRQLIADDTGSAMRRSGRNGIIHIDIRFRTIEACRQWGVRHMEVFIFDN